MWATGIDIAYLLSGAAYHTQTDTLDAIRPGVLQETGESMTAGIRSLAAALSAAAAVSEPADAPSAAAEAAGSKQQQQQTLQDLLEPVDHRRMFVSIASSVMLTYSGAAAQLLHHMPLVLVLSAPHTLQLLSPSTVRGVHQLCSAHGPCLQWPCRRQHALCMVVLWRLSVLAYPAFQATPVTHLP